MLAAGETRVTSFILVVSIPAVESPTFVTFVEGFVGSMADVEVVSATSSDSCG